MHFTTLKSCMSIIRIKVSSLYHLTEVRQYNHKYKYTLRHIIQWILRMKQRINNKTDIASRNASRDRIVLSVRCKTGCPCMFCYFLVSNMFAPDSHYFCSQDAWVHWCDTWDSQQGQNSLALWGGEYAELWAFPVLPWSAHHLKEQNPQVCLKILWAEQGCAPSRDQESICCTKTQYQCSQATRAHQQNLLIKTKRLGKGHTFKNQLDTFFSFLSLNHVRR